MCLSIFGFFVSLGAKYPCDLRSIIQSWILPKKRTLTVLSHGSSVSQLPGKHTAPGMQVLVQGNQIAIVAKFLLGKLMAARTSSYPGSSFLLTNGRETSEPGKFRFEVRKYRTSG